MYDTVFFKINQSEAKGVDFLSELPNYLDRVGLHYFDGVPVISGMVNNLRVTASQHQVKVKDGSLCKFLFGNNYNTMGRHDAQRAVEMLSDSLHLPMDKATITRLDFAQNFIMQYPLDVYYNHLGLLSRAQRLQEPNGLYYIISGGRLCFYDKNREQRAHNEPIPPLYQNQNVLRVEQRYLQRLPQRLHRPEVKGATLYDRVFYNDLLNRWRDGYKSIQKINDKQPKFEIMSTVRGTLLRAFATVIEREGGELTVIEQINEGYKMGKYSKKMAHDLRETVKRACAIARSEGIKPDFPIQELDTKIDQAVRMNR